jgi:curved DNA binding protein
MSEHGSDSEEQELDLRNSDVVTKYKASAKIANNVLAWVIKGAKPGAKIVQLCTEADKQIIEATGKEFKGKNIEKGSAFPTCISPNNVVGHLSPPEEDTTELQEGDLIKIDLGVHIDGWTATGAHTMVVGKPEVSGRAAEVLAATQTAFEAALRTIRPGKHIADVAPMLAKVVEAYDCHLVEGVLSHEQKRFVIDGNKCVLNKPTPEMRVEDGEFEENEVYAIDIVVSTGEGKTKVLDEKQTTVYKRALDERYSLKLKAARQIFKEISDRFPALPFTTRALPTQGGAARLGLTECVGHGLLQPYPVLYEKAGELVAQLKSTVLLMPNGSDRLISQPVQPVKTDKAVQDEEVKALLATSIKKKKANKKKAAANGAEAEKA